MDSIYVLQPLWIWVFMTMLTTSSRRTCFVPQINLRFKVSFSLILSLYLFKWKFETVRFLVQGHPRVGGRTEVTSRSVSIVLGHSCFEKRKDIDTEKNYSLFFKEILLWITTDTKGLDFYQEFENEQEENTRNAVFLLLGSSLNAHEKTCMLFSVCYHNSCLFSCGASIS